MSLLNTERIFLNKKKTENIILKKPKPFLKWAGGKTQLLEIISANLPIELINGKITRYVEPFVGSGAVLFFLLSKNLIKEAFIFDINKNLINLYKTIKNNVEELIETLELYENEYKLKNTNERKVYYYEKREEYNNIENDLIKKSALMIFLNRTCFNGLYRENSAGKFNVPFGKYKNPKICNKENLLSVSKALKIVNIYHGDFEESIRFINNRSFVYLDPPYKPLNKTSNFTAYSKYSFTDKDQIRLKLFFDNITKKGAKALLSNSDPTNGNKDRYFFDELYKGYKIERILAKRTINSNAAKRGVIKEILVKNY